LSIEESKEIWFPHGDLYKGEKVQIRRKENALKKQGSLETNNIIDIVNKMNLAERIIGTDESKKFISERLSNIYKYAFWFKFYA